MLFICVRTQQYYFVLDETFIYNQDANDIPGPSVILYSIVGGSSTAAILFLPLVIVLLASFLKKVYKPVQRTWYELLLLKYATACT